MPAWNAPLLEAFRIEVVEGVEGEHGLSFERPVDQCPRFRSFCIAANCAIASLSSAWARA